MWGKIVSSVTSVLDINQATLSGCIDIIIVQQNDGTYLSTPFHVRFGKVKLLKSREKIVTINVNNIDVDLTMKLGSAGEAYFIQEIESNEYSTEDILSPESSNSFESPVLSPRQVSYSGSPIKSLNNSDIFQSESENINIINDLNIKLSLCGHLLYGTEDNYKHDEYVFNANLITYEQFDSDENLWYHPCLVAKINDKPPYYPIKVFYPLLTSLKVFNKPSSITSINKYLGIKHQTEYSIKENDNNIVNYSIGDYSVDTLNNFCTVQSAPIHCRKSLRPTSEQIKTLGLKFGANRVTYTVVSSLQGKQTVSGTIYLWPSDSRIIISDVDGTITKSDVLGQLMPIVGRDWSHSGVAELLSKIEQNGYKIVYLTARAIGQADITRDFLFRLKQNGNVTLPDGPVFLSPDRLFPSLKREVIDRKPYIFKIAALRDIRNIFPSYRNPLYAGFGNRETDYRAYAHVGIPEGKIFIIDSTGLIHHVNRTYAKTYETMTEIVEYMFPPMNENLIKTKDNLTVNDDQIKIVNDTEFKFDKDEQLDLLDDKVRKQKFLTHLMSEAEGGFDCLLCKCNPKFILNVDEIIV